MSDPLIDIFADVLGLDAGSLSEDTSPENTPEWDSLAAMLLVSAIESKFDVRLKTRDIMKMASISQARSILKQYDADV